jgi:hypothetical protein
MFDMAARLLVYYQFHDLLKETIMLLLAGTPLVLVVMLLHKVVTERHELRTTREKHQYLSACYCYLADPSYDLPQPRTRRETIALTDVLIYLLAETAPEKHPLLQGLATSMQVADLLRRQATTGRSWVSRLSAIEKLGFLRLPEMAPLYRDLLAHEQEPHVIAKLLWALSQVATSFDLHFINRILIARPVFSGKFNELLYWNIINGFVGRGEGGELLERIEEMLTSPELSLQLKRDLVEACGSGLFGTSLPLLRRACVEYSGEPTMKIACLRAIGALGGDLDGELTRQALVDPDWRVRAVAARNASLTSKEMIPALALLLGDPNYHVRINAARSLGALGEEGRSILRTRSTGEDRFVRDVCTYILEDV